jgi:hypothetical protein
MVSKKTDVSGAKSCWSADYTASLVANLARSLTHPSAQAKLFLSCPLPRLPHYIDIGDKVKEKKKLYD